MFIPFRDGFKFPPHSRGSSRFYCTCHLRLQERKRVLKRRAWVNVARVSRGALTHVRATDTSSRVGLLRFCLCWKRHRSNRGRFDARASPDAFCSRAFWRGSDLEGHAFALDGVSVCRVFCVKKIGPGLTRYISYSFRIVEPLHRTFNPLGRRIAGCLGISAGRERRGHKHRGDKSDDDQKLRDLHKRTLQHLHAMGQSPFRR